MTCRITASALRCALAFALLGTLALPAHAEPALLMTLQGFAASNAGGPISDGTYGITVRLYEEASGGAPIYLDVAPAVGVKGGLFTMQVGEVKPLDPALFAAGKPAWVGVQIGAEPELPRVPFTYVPYALRASAAASLACSGCVGATQIDPNALKPFAKAADLSQVAFSGSYGDLPDAPILTKVATSGSYDDLIGKPDLTVYATSAALHKVATSGLYADLQGLPSLSAVATSGKYTDLLGAPTLAPVATSGNYSDLKGKPTLAALSLCGAGQVLKGFNADGSASCVQDQNTATTYGAGTGLTLSGTTFNLNPAGAALGGVKSSTCTGSNKVTGIDATGTIVCGADVDTDTNTTYGAGTGLTLSGTTFNLNPAGATIGGVKSSTCSGSNKVTGIDGSGNLTCGADSDTNSGGTVTSVTAGTGLAGGTITTSGTIAVNFAGTGSAATAARSDHGHAHTGMCYTHWGSTACATGFTAVVTGRPGGFESYENGSTAPANVECVSGSASVLQSWTSTFNMRMMRAQADTNGMEEVQNTCAICCSGGCYTALGTQSCASGYTNVYNGHVGGIDAYNGPQIHGKTLCIEDTATATSIWNSGYDNRLMRHRPSNAGNANGMDSVTNSCAVCCM